MAVGEGDVDEEGERGGVVIIHGVSIQHKHAGHACVRSHAHTNAGVIEEEEENMASHPPIPDPNSPSINGIHKENYFSPPTHQKIHAGF